MNRALIKFRISLCVCFIILITGYASAQQNVGIGTATPDSSAILDLTSGNKGLLIPRVTLNNASLAAPVTNPAQGLLIYNIDGSEPHGFWFWNGVQWIQAGAGGGGCVTLDEAYDCGGGGNGRIITADSGSVEINAGVSGTIGLKVTHSTVGVAISAISSATTNTYSTIQATTASNQAGIAAVLGNSSGNGYGVSGQVAQTATAPAAVYGNNLRTNGGFGVQGFAYNGVVGNSNYADGFGVYGSNTGTLATGDGVGVYGIGSGVGVMGQLNAINGNGVFGNNINTTSGNSIGVAGLGVTGILGQSSNISLSYGILSNDDMGVMNQLDVGGNFNAGGTKSFRIDHPTDPENKFLQHFCIESPEVLNLYRGSAVLNANGEAIVKLPDYFTLINTNFTYTLTPIGSSAPNLFIKEKIRDGNFTIAGGAPGLEVSWVVYAERNDLYMQNHPEAKNTEPVKQGRYKGKYIHPELFGQPESKGLFHTKSLLYKNELIQTEQKIKEINNAQKPLFLLKY
ncbi:MAG: hypothetical protein HY738_15865 [Bacteroidia bacterium]|nr:hypothetical protein [Bacteroidia bacterium]